MWKRLFINTIWLSFFTESPTLNSIFKYCIYLSRSLSFEFWFICFVVWILQICKCVSFWLHDFCGKWEGWDPVNRLNHTSWVAIVTPTDHPKSLRYWCVIEVYGGVFVLSCCFFFGFSVGVGAFVIGLSQISSFFSCTKYSTRHNFLEIDNTSYYCIFHLWRLWQFCTKEAAILRLVWNSHVRFCFDQSAFFWNAFTSHGSRTAQFIPLGKAGNTTFAIIMRPPAFNALFKGNISVFIQWF